MSKSPHFQEWHSSSAPNINTRNPKYARNVIFVISPRWKFDPYLAWNQFQCSTSPPPPRVAQKLAWKVTFHSVVGHRHSAVTIWLFAYLNVSLFIYCYYWHLFHLYLKNQKGKSHFLKFFVFVFFLFVCLFVCFCIFFFLHSRIFKCELLYSAMLR